jgi:dipeptidase E
MKLFLTSGGIPSSLVPDFLEFLGRDPKNLKAVFIPTAAEDPSQWFVKASRDELTDLGFEVTDVDLEKVQGNELKEILSEQDIIYVNGGNTFKLLHFVRESAFDQYIKEFLEQGKVYIGTSAGSVLMGPNIALAGWEPHGDENYLGLTDLSGLDLVEFAVSPHLQEHSVEHLKKEKKDFPYQVIALTDDQAVEVKDDFYKVVGKGETIILD